VKKASLNNLIVVLGVTAIMAVTSTTQASALRIEESRTNQFLDCIELVNNAFELSFIHSVSLTPVYDSYQLVDNNQTYNIIQTQERFFAHGQGLPSLADEPDAIAFEHSDGQFILKLQRAINNLIVRTDRRFKNRLYTGQTTINLNQWPDTGLSILPVAHCQL